MVEAIFTEILNPYRQGTPFEMFKNRFTSVLTCAFAASLALAGCAISGNPDNSKATVTAQEQGKELKSGVYTSNTKNGEKIDAQTHFTQEDVTWNQDAVLSLNLADPTATDGVSEQNGTITITKGGTYRMSGDYTGQVKVQAPKTDKVQLILDGVNITNETGSAINITSADEAVIYTSRGSTNNLSDGPEYAVQGKKEADSTIYSTANLTLAGDGTLNIAGKFDETVHTTKGLVVAGGALNINSSKTGLKGKDYVDIQGGTLRIEAAKDAIKATNTEKQGLGWARVAGGDTVLRAGDDGIKALRTLEILDGKLTIEGSEEGLEGQYVNIHGGNTLINSNNDGVNASLKDQLPNDQEYEDQKEDSDQPDASPVPLGGARDTTEVIDTVINMTGGNVTLNVGADGMDSNGFETYTGGTLLVNGPTNDDNNPLDPNGDLLINGDATITAAGGGLELYKAPSEASEEGYVRLVDEDTIPVGQSVQATDASGNVVGNYRVTIPGVKQVLFANPSIVKGQEYQLYVVPDLVDPNVTTLAPGATLRENITASTPNL
jgi:hypothetical protein